MKSSSELKSVKLDKRIQPSLVHEGQVLTIDGHLLHDPVFDVQEDLLLLPAMMVGWSNRIFTFSIKFKGRMLSLLSMSSLSIHATHLSKKTVPKKTQTLLNLGLVRIHIDKDRLSFFQFKFSNGNLIDIVQGDESCCQKPPVDFKTKLPFWPGQARTGEAKAELLF